MTRYTLIAFILLACACGQGKKEKAPSTLPLAAGIDSCALQKQNARTDLANGRLKYYVYGIAAPTPEFIARYKAHNIEVVSWGCVLPQGLNCYNTLVDSMMHR